MKTLAAVLLFPFFVSALDLAAVKAEPNLERRSEKALLFAGEVLTAMRKEIGTADTQAIQTQLREFRSAVDLCVQSLEETGKNARRSPKYFKRAEQRMRDLNRRLATLKGDLPIDDRPLLDEVTRHVDKKIDELVEATLRGS